AAVTGVAGRPAGAGVTVIADRSVRLTDAGVAAGEADGGRRAQTRGSRGDGVDTVHVRNQSRRRGERALPVERLRPARRAGRGRAGRPDVADPGDGQRPGLEGVLGVEREVDRRARTDDDELLRIPGVRRAGDVASVLVRNVHPEDARSPLRLAGRAGVQEAGGGAAPVRPVGLGTRATGGTPTPRSAEGADPEPELAARAGGRAAGPPRAAAERVRAARR